MKKSLIFISISIVLFAFAGVSLTGCISPLATAAYNGKTETVRKLLNDKNIDINEINACSMTSPTMGYTPLMCAVEKGNIEIVKLFIEQGADINVSSGRGTALHIAVEHGYNDIARLLLDKGADINIVGSPGPEYDAPKGTPLQIAQLKGNRTLVHLLTQAEEKQIARYDKEDLTVQSDTPDSAVQEPGPSTPINMSTDDIHFGPYYALVIGNNNYRHVPRLNTAVNDAKSVGLMLQNDYGFKVKLITDGTRSNILEALDAFRAQLTQNDNLLIYYAGHGYYDKDAERGYWLPVDARTTTRANWISNVDVTDTLKATKAKHVMIVADSCYSGTLTRSVHVALRNPDWLYRISQKKARTVLTSGGNEPVADSGGGAHSVFAQSFLKALKENTGVMDGTLLFNTIRRPIMLNSDQTPQYSDIQKAGHDGGDFLFVKTR